MQLSKETHEAILKAYAKGDFEKVCDLWRAETAVKPRRADGNADDGTGQLSRADLDGLTAEQLVAARKAGRVDGVASD